MRFEDKIHQGVHWLIDNGQIETAEWMLDKLLADYPNHSQAHHEKAVFAHRNGDITTAGAHFFRAAELDQGNADYLKSLGDFYFVSQENAEKALEQYHKVLALVPREISTLLTAGHLCVVLQRFDEARECYRSVLEIEPGQPDATQFLDQMAAKSSQEEAQHHPNSFAPGVEAPALAGIQGLAPPLNPVGGHPTEEIDPDDAQAHNDLGIKCYDRGDVEAALHHYETAVRLMPENIVFLKNLGDLLWNEKNDAGGALKIFVEVLKRDPQDMETLLSCGQICMAIGKVEDSRDFIELALTIEPWNQDARMLLEQLDSNDRIAAPGLSGDELYMQAQSKANNGDSHGAIDDLNLLVSTSTDYPVAYNDLGVLYYETGDKERALASYEKAYEMAPEQPNIIKNLADFYLIEQERVEEAMKLYVKVLEKTPEDIECLMATALVCTIMGKNVDAIDFYRKVIAIEPWNHEARQAIERLQKGPASSRVNVGNQQAIG